MLRYLSRTREAGAREVIAVIADTGSQASIAVHRRAGFRETGRGYRAGATSPHEHDGCAPIA